MAGLKSHSTGMSGLTLIELLVTLVILSILATAAMPYAEITITRTKELELKRSLREMRTAIDRFHYDWVTGKIAKSNSDASDNGYPVTLQVLVTGVEDSGANGIKHKYLRRIPNDPFVENGAKPDEQWLFRGYTDEVDSSIWNGKDVYDIHSKSDRTALDGSKYNDW